MPRTSRNSDISAIDGPSLLPDDFSDAGSAVIRFAQLSAGKSQKTLSDGCSGNVPAVLDEKQVQYVNMRISGIGLVEACKALSIDAAVPMLWEEECGKDSVFAHCVAAIKRKQALVLEDSMWEQATTDGRSSRDSMRIALLNARMPEYRPNAPAITVPVQVNISIEREPYSIDIGGDCEVVEDER